MIRSFRDRFTHSLRRPVLETEKQIRFDQLELHQDERTVARNTVYASIQRNLRQRSKCLRGLSDQFFGRNQQLDAATVLRLDAELTGAGYRALERRVTELAVDECE